MSKRKNNVNNINLKVDRVLSGGTIEQSILRIEWSSDIGHGNYDLVFNNQSDGLVITGNSEFMDSNNDKDFLKKLMSIIIDNSSIK